MELMSCIVKTYTGYKLQSSSIARIELTTDIARIYSPSRTHELHSFMRMV